MLIAEKPAARPTMADIIAHPWMKQEVASHEEFQN